MRKYLVYRAWGIMPGVLYQVYTWYITPVVLAGKVHLVQSPGYIIPGVLYLRGVVYLVCYTRYVAPGVFFLVYNS